MSNLDQSIKAAKEQKLSYDNFWKENLVQEIAKGGVAQEKALQRISSLENLSEIRTAKIVLKPEEFARLQELSLQKLFSMSADLPSNIFASPFAGKGLSEAIQNIGRDKMEEMWGPELTSDLVDLGKTLRLTFGKDEGAGMAGALRAGAFMFHPLSHIPAIIASNIEMKLMRSSGFIRWVTIGLEGDSKAAQAVQRITQFAAYEASRSLAAAALRTPPEYGQAQ
jgi:hypothetical protein